MSTSHYKWSRITHSFKLKKMRKPNVKRIKNQIWHKCTWNMHPDDWHEYKSELYEYIVCLVAAFNADDEKMYWQAFDWLYQHGIKGIT